jgi:hypothetical protein
VGLVDREVAARHVPARLPGLGVVDAHRDRAVVPGLADQVALGLAPAVVAAEGDVVADPVRAGEVDAIVGAFEIAVIVGQNGAVAAGTGGVAPGAGAEVDHARVERAELAVDVVDTRSPAAEALLRRSCTVDVRRVGRSSSTGVSRYQG